MKQATLLFATFFLLTIHSQITHSQTQKALPTFKIVGKTKVTIPNGEKTVEYDPESANHLYITDYSIDGKIVSKRQFLFSGKKFNLSIDYLVYSSKKKIILDGFHTFYNSDGSIQNSLEYHMNSLLRKFTYYPSGQKQSMIPGIKTLNGEYKIWYPNGNMIFSGNYKNNLKNGDFELFAEMGTSIKKGVYQNGKLISGEPVVQDIIFDNPEVPARYNQGETAFDEYLTKKAESINTSWLIHSGQKFNLDITFNETGKMITINNKTRTDRANNEALRIILKECPAYSPATIENIPVKSIQKVILFFSPEGIKMRQEEKIYDKVDILPEFPGGQVALNKFIFSNLKYPKEILKSKVQGKVFVRFIIDEEGNIVEPNVIRGLHPLLDAEAVRVVKMMPKWIPGQFEGKTVKVTFTIPFNIVLE